MLKIFVDFVLIQQFSKR